MRTVGIIGGLGPQTTADLYMRLVALSQERESAQARIPVLISSVPLPFLLEERALAHGKDLELLVPFLIDAARNLEHGGADFLILACNSLHIFFEEIRSAVRIPIISIVQETISEIQRVGFTRVGLLGTGITIQSKLYEYPLKRKDVTCIYPQALEQKQLGADIYSIVVGANLPPIDTLGNILERFADSGVECAVLACTDLKLLLRKKPDSIRIIDTVEVLAQAAIREAYADQQQRLLSPT